MPQSKKLDIVLFGATGFTGELIAEYLARAQLHEPFRWAIAGRDPQKLERLKTRLCSINPAVREDLQLIIAESDQPETLRAMAARTRVVLSVVGPYIHHGEALVAACIEAGADYADLTGEPEFVDRMIQRYQAAAAERKVKIIHSCGFDSIPHDLGVFYTLRQLAQRLGKETMRQSDVKVEGFVRAGGRLSGGTWHSAIHAFSRAWDYLQQRRERETHRRGSPREVGSLMPTLKYRAEVGAWALPFPTIDPMVIERTATELDSYGQRFHYGHYVRVKRLPRVLMGVAAVASVFTLAQIPPARNWLLKQKPQGSGPSAAQRAYGHFSVIFIAHCDGLKLTTQVSGGDPGYTETAKMLGETGLCLALDRRVLPKHYGIVTPVVGMGKRLLQRLELAGIRFEVIKEEDCE